MVSKLIRNMLKDKGRSEKLYVLYSVTAIIANIMIAIGMIIFIILLIRK